MATLYDLLGKMAEEKSDDMDRYLKSVAPQPATQTGIGGYGSGTSPFYGPGAAIPQPIQPVPAAPPIQHQAAPAVPQPETPAAAPGLNRLEAMNSPQNNPYAINAAALPESGSSAPTPFVSQPPSVAEALAAAQSAANTPLQRGRMNVSDTDMMNQNGFTHVPVGRTPEEKFARGSMDAAVGTPEQQKAFERILDRSANTGLERQQQIADLERGGATQVSLPGSAPGGTLDSQVWKQASAPKPLSQMPQAVQDQAARQGITDLNTLYEQMNYTVPGGKGSATGWRKVDPNRPQGSFSVAPALSESEKERYNQIVANETRQREYAQGRGPQWDTAQANQASNAVAALKQVMAQQKDQRDYGLQKETLAETKSKNRMDAEAKAAQIEQSLIAERNKANRVDPKWIPTLTSILETEQKNAPVTSKLTSNQHLSNGLLTRGIKTATDLKNPPDGLFIYPDDPSQVFMRDPKTHAVTSLGLTEDYLKRWAMNHYAGTGADPIERVAPPSP